MSVRRIRRTISVALLAVVAVTALVLVTGRGGADRTLIAHFASTTNVIENQEVRVGGVRVGHVADVELGSDDVGVTLRIDDARVWPLHRGTTATLRFGTTVADAGRYIELHPGAASAPSIPDDGVLTSADTSVPVEFDQIFNTFDRQTRGDLRGLLRNLDASLDGKSQELASGLRATPGGLDAVASVMDQVGASREVLSTLVRSAARTSTALSARDRQLRDLLTGAAATFDEFADSENAISQTLERSPATLSQARRTLTRTRRSLGTLTALVSDLVPGAQRLQAVAPTAAGAVAALAEVAPDAAHTLAVARTVSPPLTSLLAEAEPVVRVAGPVAARGGKDVACVRPYTPDAAAFISNWAGFSANADKQGHFMRAQIQATPVVNGTPLTSKESIGLLGLRYAFPTPPGWSAGQTWLQPDCGAGGEALNAAKDPEARR